MRIYNAVAFLLLALLLYAVGMANKAWIALGLGAVAEIGFWIQLLRRDRPAGDRDGEVTAASGAADSP
ncbi:MAG: hypothetical protein AAF725_22180 [Acidobacteriota bacterium]